MKAMACQSQQGQAQPLMGAGRIVFRIASIILIAEFAIMVFLGAVVPEADSVTSAFLDVTLLAALSTPAIYCWVIRDFVVARDEALVRVEALALTDSLTGLANRRQLIADLERLIASSDSHKVQGALLLIDLDGFKAINDDFGHQAGDALLVEVAQRIGSEIRGEDLAARIGGDEFVVLVRRLESNDGLSVGRARDLAERIISRIRCPFAYEENSLQVGASIRIRLLGHHLGDPAQALTRRAAMIISQADEAMYRAKQDGKSRAAVYDDQGGNGVFPPDDLASSASSSVDAA